MASPGGPDGEVNRVFFQNSLLGGGVQFILLDRVVPEVKSSFNVSQLS